MNATGEALRQGGSIRAQLEKLSAQANTSTKEPMEAFEKKINALLGRCWRIFSAPVSQDVTLGRVNGQAGTLYSEVWQADAEPTSTQVEAMSADAAGKAPML